MNKYNPNIHHRRSIRLKGYDYTQAGLYFITICCENRTCRFGNIENGEMILNEYGMIAYTEWQKLIERFKNFELDVFQIMPNHIHGIIALTVGATLAVAQNDAHTQNDADTQNDENVKGQPQGIARTQNDDINNIGDANGIGDANVIGDIRAGASPAPTATLFDVVGAYKSLVANRCLEIYKSNYAMAGFTPDQIPMFGKLWQRNYYEHIIRDEKSYQTISNYIINNPAKWVEDKFYV